jgi:hypothetical protein
VSFALFGAGKSLLGPRSGGFGGLTVVLEAALHLEDEDVTLAVLALEVLRAAEAAESAADHDAAARAQRLVLFRDVAREDD